MPEPDATQPAAAQLTSRGPSTISRYLLDPIHDIWVAEGSLYVARVIKVTRGDPNDKGSSLHGFFKQDGLSEIAQRPGVYILVGTYKGTGAPAIYVGQGKHVSHRLDEHNKRSQRLHDWHTVYCCIAWNHFMHTSRSILETKMHRWSRDLCKKQFHVTNRQIGRAGSTQFQQDECNQVFEQIKDLLGFLGFYDHLQMPWSVVPTRSEGMPDVLTADES